jgi:hypothetical protein
MWRSSAELVVKSVFDPRGEFDGLDECASRDQHDVPLSSPRPRACRMPVAIGILRRRSAATLSAQNSGNYSVALILKHFGRPDHELQWRRVGLQDAVAASHAYE